MATPKALRELRAKLYDNMKALHDEAKRNGGKLSERQQTDWDRMNSEYDGYTAKIERAERFDELEVLENERTGRMYEDDDDDDAKLIGRNTGKDDGAERWQIRGTRDTIAALPPNVSCRRAISSLSGGRDDQSAFRGLNFGKYVRAIISGPRNDLERRALSEGTDSAGGFAVPSELLAEIIDGLRSQARTIQAGARTLLFGQQADNFTIARLASDPATAWHAENATVTASDPTFEGVVFQPRTLISLIRVSRELAEDSPNIERMITQAFAGSLGSELDRVVLRGSGTAPEPRGISTTTGVGSFSMGTNGGALVNYAPFIQAIELIETANVTQPATGIILHPRDASALAQLADTTGQPLQIPPSLNDVPILSTTNLSIVETQGTSGNASRAILGHWPSVLIGLRSELRIEILRERYADSHQLGFLAHLRADVGFEHPEAMAQIIGIIP